LIASLAKLAVSDGSLRSLCLMDRFARCDIRWEPPSSSDPTKRLSWRIIPVQNAFRRLLLQIGGANIASAFDCSFHSLRIRLYLGRCSR
jgi:hypothetical protein